MKIKSTALYDVLKYLARYAFPAIAVFYASLGKTWGLPFVEEIPVTLGAVVVLLNTLLGISNDNYNKATSNVYEIEVDETEDEE